MNPFFYDLVRQAIQIALPTIRILCEKHTWGPKGVVIAVSGTGIQEPVIYIMEELGPKESWAKEWGEGNDFEKIALQKLQGALREGRTNSSLVRERPWLLQKGDSLYAGAVGEDSGLAVAVSGVYEEMDETIAWIVFNVISGLCHMRVRILNEAGIHEIS